MTNTHITKTNQPRLLIVQNPVAGRHKRSHVERVTAALRQRGINAAIYETQGPGDAMTALPKMVSNFDIVVAAGGDGTVNEVLNGMRDSDATLGIIPCGTTNVLAIELGLPTKPEAIAAVLAGDVTRNIHVATVNGRHFGMMVGIGYDAWVVAGINIALKKKIGKLAYILSIMQQLKNFGSRQYQVEIDGNTHIAASVVATLGQHYAGSYILARDARLDQPVIDIVLIQTQQLRHFLLMLLALPLGMAGKLPFIRIVQGKRVRVAPYPANQQPALRESLQADGDTAGYLPADIRIIETPIRVLVPKG